jgi:DNA polymerase elongation subunit (family B)
MSIIFNVLYWHENDENNKYIIRMFGKTDDGKSVSAKVTGFIPYFYVEIPNYWDEKKIDQFVRKVKAECDRQDKGKFSHIKHLIKTEAKEFHKFYYYTENKLFKFVRFVFDNSRSMKRFSRLFDNTLFLDSFDPDIREYPIYESNIDPFLRFIHIKDICAAGWVEVNKYEVNDEDMCQTDISIKCTWSNVNSLKDKVDIAPFKIASFDIECTSGDGAFPQANRPSDKIIQIGTVFGVYGPNNIYKKHIITLGSCAPIEGAEVESYETEKEVLEAWQKLIEREDPDIITGYNIFYFDEKYMYDRANLFNCYDTCGKLSKIVDKVCEWNEIKLSSSALGDNILRYFKMIGRVQIDLMKVVQRDYKLDSYKLDSVAEYFIKEQINKMITLDDNHYKLITKNLVKEGNYIRIEENGESMDEKFIVTEVCGDGFIIETKEKIEYNNNSKLFWGLVKDDIHAKDIFRLQKGNANDRAEIAKYCIQDCVLVLKLLYKLEIITNNISMANVCSVPISYIFLRGQGIKSLSLVSKECRKKQYLIPTMKKKDDELGNEGFEGAIVFEPEIGFHKTPVTVLDFNSLYPSSIIAKNVSHETLKHPDLNTENITRKINHDGYCDPMLSEKCKYENVKYDNSICTYAKYNKDFGILPNILLKLLAERKSTKKIMEKETDNFKKNILDGKQLALKVTANSLYGQLGASTSPIYLKKLAASTTAIGRNMLETAREFVETRLPDILEKIHTVADSIDIESILDKELEDRNNSEFKEMLLQTVNEIYDEHIIRPKEQVKKIKVNEYEYKLLDKKYLMKYKIYSEIPPYIRVGNRIRFEYNECIFDDRFTILKIGKNYFELGVSDDNSTYNVKYEEFDIEHLKWFMCMIIYGDTDSIFIRMNIINKNTKELITDNQCLKWSIILGQIASKLLKINLPYPQNMEYEKTFYPFFILAKKKYVGNKYENNPNKFKQACMGIVLKRRDNPPIVKKIIGGMLDIMLNIMDNDKVVQYVRNSIENLLDGKFSIRNFITSKALRDGYKYKDGDIDQNGKDITKTISIIDVFNNIHTDEAKKKISYVKQAHVQLAARIAIRDPGNKPQLNDRIPYVVIEVQSDKKLLQGDVIEHPDYIIKNNLKIDYLFYLTNQIMNPSIQFLELIVDEPNKIFKEYCDNIKKKKELAFNEKKQNEYVSNMINNFGFKANTNNEDWDINIDNLIKQVQNNNTEKPKPRKKKK